MTPKSGLQSHLVSSKVFLLKVGAGYLSSVTCALAGTMSFLDPEALKDSATWPRSAGPGPSPPPARGVARGLMLTVQSAQRPVLPFAPRTCSALPATHPADGQAAPSLPLLRSVVSPLPSPLLLKFRWTNKPSRKAAEVPCIYPRVHRYMKALQAGQGRTQTSTCTVLFSPRVGLGDD